MCDFLLFVYFSPRLDVSQKQKKFSSKLSIGYIIGTNLIACSYNNFLTILAVGKDIFVWTVLPFPRQYSRCPTTPNVIAYKKYRIL